MSNLSLPAAVAAVLLTAPFPLHAASVTLGSVSHSGVLGAQRITPSPATDSETISTTAFENDLTATPAPGGGLTAFARHTASGSFTAGANDSVLEASSMVSTSGSGGGGAGRTLSQGSATSIYRFTLDGAFGFNLDAEIDLGLELNSASRDSTNGLHTSSATIILRQVGSPDLIWAPDSLEITNHTNSSSLFLYSGSGDEPVAIGTSGTLGPGDYEIEISLSARVPANIGSMGVATAYAKQSFTMTFTPVPEPGPAVLAGISALLLNVRRRKMPTRCLS